MECLHYCLKVGKLVNQPPNPWSSMYYCLAGVQGVQAHILHIDEQRCDDLHPKGQLLAAASLAAEV
jgi:hypothetical protein